MQCKNQGFNHLKKYKSLQKRDAIGMQCIQHGILHCLGFPRQMFDQLIKHLERSKGCSGEAMLPCNEEINCLKSHEKKLLEQNY